MQPTKMVFIVRDISERKRTEEQINQLVHQLEIEKKAAQLNANTDILTGLANRRNFNETLKRELHRLKRSGVNLSLIMIDVDHFKNFNDHYGHIAGDNCLKRIGAMIKTIIGRETDFVARYGGDEFIAILPETDQKGAIVLAEKFRQAIENLAIPYSESKDPKYITVSLGVLTIIQTSISSPRTIMALADEALYKAKKEGRNRVYVTSENENLLIVHE